MNKKFTLGIIPARGGSKRLPKKNIKLLVGRPLIDYVISVGLRSKIIDELIVSTDCEEIKKTATASGACVPFIRPAELACDDTPTEEVIKHSVLQFEKIIGYKISIIVLLQATLPFTTVEMIEQCNDLLINEGWDTVITVNKTSVRAEWVGLLSTNKQFKQIINNKDYFKLLKQEEYIPSGNVYVLKREAIFKQKKIVGDNTGTVIVPELNAVDIDTIVDFRFAEFLLRKKYL